MPLAVIRAPMTALITAKWRRGEPDAAPVVAARGDPGGAQRALAGDEGDQGGVEEVVGPFEAVDLDAG